MADLLQQASQWLTDMRASHLSHPVQYCRGDSCVQVAASVGKTTFEIEDSYGGLERFESRDFLIRAADLVQDGQVIEPQAGDVVRETVGSRILIYKVMAPGGEPCWRYSDPFQTAIRIHTKQTDVE